MSNIDRILAGDKEALVNEIATIAAWARNLSNQEWNNMLNDSNGGLNGVIGRIVDSHVTRKDYERVVESAGIIRHDSEELEARVREAFELAGFEDKPITEEEWAAMEKYPPVPLAEYVKISDQAFRDYVKAIEDRPGYPLAGDVAVMDRYLDAVNECIADDINNRKILPFEVVAHGTLIFLPKNRRKIEGDYVVVAK